MAEHDPNCPCHREPVMDDLHCYFHGYEPARPGDFRTCGECGHIYRSKLELMERDFAVSTVGYLRYGTADEPPPKLQKVEDIWSCPFCTHDW